MMKTVNVDIGKIVEFKVIPGRGRPSVGRVLDLTARTVTLEKLSGDRVKIPARAIVRMRDAGKSRPIIDLTKRHRVAKIDNIITTSVMKRGRGRPKGAKNKPKDI